jgi:hypothetical protein
MARQNPLPAQSNQKPVVQPVEVSSLLTLQTAMQHKQSGAKRPRHWEKAHRAVGYLIPKELHLRAKDISEKLAPIAAERLTTVSSVAKAFMQFALSQVHAQKLKLQGRPKATRRTLSLHWSETKEGWPQEIKPLKRKKTESVLTKPKPLYLAHRWGADIDKEIRSLSKNTAVPGGEVVVFLLGYALDAFLAGTLHLEAESVEVSNQVSPAWGVGE